MGKWSVVHPRKQSVQCTCAQCGAEFEVAQWKLNQGKGRYCSKECYRLGSRGEGVEYDGKWFGKSGKNQYYWWKTPDKTSVSLHKYVWEKHNCKVPDGYVVHHRDHNPANNAIANLELMPDSVHASMHMRERIASGYDHRASLAKAQEAAKAWHKSEEGRAWHREHAQRMWAK